MHDINILHIFFKNNICLKKVWLSKKKKKKNQKLTIAYPPLVRDEHVDGQGISPGGPPVRRPIITKRVVDVERRYLLEAGRNARLYAEQTVLGRLVR